MQRRADDLLRGIRWRAAIALSLSLCAAHAATLRVATAADSALPVTAGFALPDDARVKKIVLANPDGAPFGCAARAALQRAGVCSALQSKSVFGDNVAQTARFVTTGDAQRGQVGLAQLGSAAEPAQKNRYWRVPRDRYPLTEQGAIVTAHGRRNPPAARYLAFPRSEGRRPHLRKIGFAVPERAP